MAFKGITAFILGNNEGGGGGDSDNIWKPTVSSNGEITWRKSTSTTTPDPQNIKGPKGDDGDPGETGPQGPAGPKGDTGDTGDAGVGIVSIEKTATVGLVDTYTVTLTDGSTYDFTVTNATSGDYDALDNKPQINGTTLSGDKTGADLGLVDAETGKGLSTNDYTDAEQTKLGGIEAGAEVNTIESITVNGTPVNPDASKNVALTVITNAVNDLVNYYKKTETYTQAEVNSLIGTISTISIEVVSSLPTTGIKTNVIYLVPSADPKTDNVKDEYINLDGTSSGWELIGSTAIDLSGYVKKSQTAGLLKNDGTVNTTLDGAVTANTSAISAIKDGTNIDSFGDVETALGNKQDTISDLSTIRSGATAGATAIQPSATAGLVKNDGTIDTTTTEAVSANTSAISAIKDGQSIDSFGDVETALADKVDWVSNGVIGAKNLGAFINAITQGNSTNGYKIVEGAGSSLIVKLNNNTDYIVSRKTESGHGSCFRIVLFNNYPTTSYETSASLVVDSPTLNTYKFSSSTFNYAVFTYDESDHYVIIPPDSAKAMVRLAADTDETYQSRAMTNSELTSKAYNIENGAGTDLDDADYFPFYDTSVSARRKTLWSNIKSKLKAYFDTLYNMYTLPTASTSTLGGVKVDGTTVTINGSGVISSASGSAVTPNPSGTASTELSKIGIDGTNYYVKDTTYSDATTSASGLMSASDKTKLNGIATGAEVNVQSDWTQTTTTADDFIKNKPNLATVATSGSYNDLSNKPTIPSTSNCYQSTDTAETTLADDDKVPFYDTSASGKRSSTWSNIKAKLKTYFDTLYTGNAGTVTSVATGVGLTGGAITGSGTIKAKLQSETASSLTAATRGATTNREYPVGIDANGNLSVNVPWSTDLGRCWVYSESSSAQYFKIYESDNANTEMTTLWLSGTIGRTNSVGYAYPFQIALNLNYNTIDGFVASGYKASHGDIILTSSGSKKRVYVALTASYSAADMFIRSLFGGGTNTSPSPETSYQGTIIAKMSDLAQLPTTPLEQSVTLSTSSTTSVTFSNDKINSNSIIEYYCSEWGIVPDDISSSGTTCTVLMPKVAVAKTVTVGIFVR